MKSHVQKQLPYVSRNYSFSHAKEENDYEQKAEIILIVLNFEPKTGVISYYFFLSQKVYFCSRIN